MKVLKRILFLAIIVLFISTSNVAMANQGCDVHSLFFTADTNGRDLTVTYDHRCELVAAQRSDLKVLIENLPGVTNVKTSEYSFAVTRGGAFSRHHVQAPFRTCMAEYFGTDPDNVIIVDSDQVPRENIELDLDTRYFYE